MVKEFVPLPQEHETQNKLSNLQQMNDVLRKEVSLLLNERSHLSFLQFRRKIIIQFSINRCLRQMTKNLIRLTELEAQLRKNKKTLSP